MKVETPVPGAALLDGLVVFERDHAAGEIDPPGGVGALLIGPFERRGFLLPHPFTVEKAVEHPEHDRDLAAREQTRFFVTEEEALRRSLLQLREEAFRDR